VVPGTVINTESPLVTLVACTIIESRSNAKDVTPINGGAGFGATSLLEHDIQPVISTIITMENENLAEEVLKRINMV